MVEKLKELEDEIHLDLEDIVDKMDKNSSDEKKNLQAVLKRIGDIISLKAKKVHDLDKNFYRENQ